MLTPSQKGSIAESAIVYQAVKLGIGVYKPLNEGLRYDLIFDIGPRMLRVQCKSASRRGDVLAIPCYSSRRAIGGYVKRSYTAQEIDALAVHCPAPERCFFLPLENFKARSYVQLRLGPPRNNQKRGINWAEEFDFAAKLSELRGP